MYEYKFFDERTLFYLTLTIGELNVCLVYCLKVAAKGASELTAAMGKSCEVVDRLKVAGECQWSVVVSCFKGANPVMMGVFARRHVETKLMGVDPVLDLVKNVIASLEIRKVEYFNYFYPLQEAEDLEKITSLLRTTKNFGVITNGMANDLSKKRGITATKLQVFRTYKEGKSFITAITSFIYNNVIEEDEVLDPW